MNMLIEERYNLITNVLQDRKTVTIEELCNLLGVSKDTVRRDLITLEKRKVLKRTFGGAMLASKPVPALRHEQRLSQFRMAKDIIADAAVQLVKNNSVVMFDSSTTVQATVPLLAGKGIQAVTNSLPTAQSLSLIDDCRISLLPGTLHREQLYVIGADTIEKIASYHFDVCFLGVFALDSCGLYTHTEEEGLVKKQMIRQSSLTVALADHTKFDTVGFYKVGPLECIDVLVTDEKPSPALLEAVKTSGVKLLTAALPE